MPPTANVARCHPERKHRTLGLCAPCYHAEYKRSNPEKVKARALRYYQAHKEEIQEQRKRLPPGAQREWQLFHKYGLRLPDYVSLLETQNGACAICGEELRQPQIDHVHGTSRVRGLLCWHCNVGLGHFRDDATRLIAAADYLSKDGNKDI